MLAIIACIMFVCYSLGVDPDSFNLGWMGLAFLAASLVLDAQIFGLVRTRRA